MRSVFCAALSITVLLAACGNYGVNPELYSGAAKAGGVVGADTGNQAENAFIITAQNDGRGLMIPPAPTVSKIRIAVDNPQGYHIETSVSGEVPPGSAAVLSAAQSAPGVLTVTIAGAARGEVLGSYVLKMGTRDNIQGNRLRPFSDYPLPPITVKSFDTAVTSVALSYKERFGDTLSGVRTMSLDFADGSAPPSIELPYETVELKVRAEDITLRSEFAFAEVRDDFPLPSDTTPEKEVTLNDAVEFTVYAESGITRKYALAVTRGRYIPKIFVSAAASPGGDGKTAETAFDTFDAAMDAAAATPVLAGDPTVYVIGALTGANTVGGVFSAENLGGKLVHVSGFDAAAGFSGAPFTAGSITLTLSALTFTDCLLSAAADITLDGAAFLRGGITAAAGEITVKDSRFTDSAITASGADIRVSATPGGTFFDGTCVFTAENSSEVALDGVEFAGPTIRIHENALFTARNTRFGTAYIAVQDRGGFFLEGAPAFSAGSTVALESGRTITVDDAVAAGASFLVTLVPDSPSTIAAWEGRTVISRSGGASSPRNPVRFAVGSPSDAAGRPWTVNKEGNLKPAEVIALNGAHRVPFETLSDAVSLFPGIPSSPSRLELCAAVGGGTLNAAPGGNVVLDAAGYFMSAVNTSAGGSLTIKDCPDFGGPSAIQVGGTLTLDGTLVRTDVVLNNSAAQVFIANLAQVEPGKLIELRESGGVWPRVTIASDSVSLAARIATLKPVPYPAADRSDVPAVRIASGVGALPSDVYTRFTVASQTGVSGYWAVNSGGNLAVSRSYYVKPGGTDTAPTTGNLAGKTVLTPFGTLGFAYGEAVQAAGTYGVPWEVVVLGTFDTPALVGTNMTAGCTMGSTADYLISIGGSPGRSITFRGLEGASPADIARFDGGNSRGVVKISGGAEITFAGITIARGSSAGSGGGLFLEGASVVTLGTGAIIGNAPGVSLDENSASSGGGIAVSGAHTKLTINDGALIRGNSAAQGGGVYLVPNGGSGVLCAEVSMNGGAIEYNDASGEGAGVFIGSGGKLSMFGGSIKNNTAVDKGGGVYVDAVGGSNNAGSFVMGLNLDPHTGRVENNSAGTGGGVYIVGGGVFNKFVPSLNGSGGVISGNSTTPISGNGSQAYKEDGSYHKRELPVSGGDLLTESDDGTKWTT